MSDIGVEQLVHGYRHGHEQLAGTVRLTAGDAELVTRLSDLSGNLSAGLNFESYLTVYPLPSRTYFAVARTWPDAAAPRAGCVLTHTLLVPTDQWARLSEPRQLDRLLRRPNVDVSSDYQSAVPFPSGLRPSRSPAVPAGDAEAGATFVTRYFGDGIRPVVWFGSTEPEVVLWHLLHELWPSLRASFACCTFALQQRTLSDRPFDLLFAPSHVYSRFSRLSRSHIVEGADPISRNPGKAEPWCRRWAEILFGNSADAAFRDRPLWNDLPEDPTSVGRLFLVNELRGRASQSPTAAVGAIDIVESLAKDARAAMPLKLCLIREAIDAASRAPDADEAIHSLRLIDDRLGREAFRAVAANVAEDLAGAAAKRAKQAPTAALKVGATLLGGGGTLHSLSAFARGVVRGLVTLADEAPAELRVLRSYPEAASVLLQAAPSTVLAYLRASGADSSRRDVSTWLSTVRDPETIRALRQSLLPLLGEDGDAELLDRLLRDVSSGEVASVLATLAKQCGGFAAPAVRQVVAERLAAAHPQQVRDWAVHTTTWSVGVASLVAASYSMTQVGLRTLLADEGMPPARRADVLALMLSELGRGKFPYWVREIAENDSAFWDTLLAQAPAVTERTAAAADKVLGEISGLPVWSSEHLLFVVLSCAHAPFFPRLLDMTVRALLAGLVAGEVGQETVNQFLQHAAARDWLRHIESWELVRTLTPADSRDATAWVRAWTWLANTPPDLYQRQPPVLPDVIDALLRCVRTGWSDAVTDLWLGIMRRTTVEADRPTRLALCTKALRFSFDNTQLPLGAVVAEAFQDVYTAVVRSDRLPPEAASLFNWYSWDKGKELRDALVGAFTSSNWRPGYLATAVGDVGLLRKIFKRLIRRPSGVEYAHAVLADLVRTEGGDVAPLRDALGQMLSNPAFHEDWD